MGRRIRIVFMIDSLDGTLGGTENQLVKIINGIDKTRFEAFLICLKETPWLAGSGRKVLQCKTKVVDINGIGNPHSYGNFLRLVRLLREYKPDIVQTFFPVSNILGVLAARLSGVSNIVSSRRDYGEWMSGKYLFATRFANVFVKKIIANSMMVKDLTLKKEKVAGAKVEMFYNGIDIKAFHGRRPDLEFKKQLGIGASDKVVGILANFRPMKHHQTFLKAAAEIASKRNGVSFLLIGGGPLMEETERLAKELKLDGRAHFTGAQKDVARYLSIVDVGVNCSEGEGLSNAVMEYMCSGIPCVVSEAGGNLDLIKDGVNGYTFRLDDHGALASLILKLLDDEPVRQRFAKSAFEHIKKHMSLETMLSTHEQFYKKLANAAG